VAAGTGQENIAGLRSAPQKCIFAGSGSSTLPPTRSSVWGSAPGQPYNKEPMSDWVQEFLEQE
jgi:hypothetical protein